MGDVLKQKIGRRNERTTLENKILQLQLWQRKIKQRYWIQGERWQKVKKQKAKCGAVNREIAARTSNDNKEAASEQSQVFKSDTLTQLHHGQPIHSCR